jgi:hypothetical protein
VIRPLRLPILALLLAATACDRKVEVDHPFYLWSIESPDETALFRCPRGPDEGCAIDGLPGPRVFAAGADPKHVVVASTQGYFYFARVSNETGGWGANPEKIVGPLTEEEFESAKAKLGLPDFTVRP